MKTLAPLNGLQSMMLRWEEFHSLNAIHVIQLGHRQNPQLVQQVLQERCLSLGLTPVEFVKGRRAIRFAASNANCEQSAFPYRAIKLQSPIWKSLEVFLNGELNVPFPKGLHWPFRFWLVDTTDQGQFLILNYQHAISDSRGISLLLREVIRALHGKAPVISSLDRSPPSLRKMLPEKLTVNRLFRRSLEFLNELKASATCFHHHRRFSGELSIGSGIQTVSIPTHVLKQTSRRLKVKVQDVLFASLLEALSLHFADELRATSRKTLAVYAPADLRRESAVNVDNAIGQLLGCITSRIKVREQSTFREIVQNVSVQSNSIKESKSYRDHALHMEIMSRIWDTFPRRLNRIAGPYLIPLSGFISNVNLTEFLQDEIESGHILNYFRFSGTGLLTPMMLGLTTVGANCNLTTTHHRNVFNADEITRLVAHVQWRLEGELDEIATVDRFFQTPTISALPLPIPLLQDASA